MYFATLLKTTAPVKLSLSQLSPTKGDPLDPARKGGSEGPTDGVNLDPTEG